MDSFSSHFSNPLEAIRALGCGTGLRIVSEMKTQCGEALVTPEQMAEAEACPPLFSRNYWSRTRAVETAKCFTKNDYFIVIGENDGRLSYTAFDPLWFTYVSRISPIVGDHAQLIIEALQNSRYYERILRDIPDWVFAQIDHHDYRAEYAALVYKQYAAPIEQLQPECIHTIKNPYGDKRFDRNALKIAATAIGLGYWNDRQIASFIAKKI